MVPRPPALPVVSHRRGWFQGVVHRPVELLNHPLPPGSRQRRTPGESTLPADLLSSRDGSRDQHSCLYLPQPKTD